MHVEFVSFGYKHGVPRDADLLIDVRFLQNPHYVPELAAATPASTPRWPSSCAPSPGLDDFRARLEALLDFLLPAYAEEGKASVVIGIGCTGGRHRSVDDRRDAGPALRRRDFDVSVSHRHIAPRRARPTRGAGG